MCFLALAVAVAVGWGCARGDAQLESVSGGPIHASDLLFAARRRHHERRGPGHAASGLALAAWMIHNGFGKPLDKVAAPITGVMVNQDEDPYLVPEPPGAAPSAAPAGVTQFLSWRVRPGWLLRYLALVIAGGVVLGAVAFLFAWAVLGNQSGWVIAAAAVLQTATAIAIVALTRSLVGTARQALSTAGYQTAAMFEANLNSRVQRETEAMAVLDLKRPIFRPLPDDVVEITFPVRNTTTYPALSISLQIGTGPWPRDWALPPHDWIQAHSIQRTDQLGVLPPGESHDFVIHLTRQWSAPLYTVQAEASGLFGGLLWQTWELDFTAANPPAWRQLEVYVIPRTPGAEPIQHRTWVETSP